MVELVLAALDCLRIGRETVQVSSMPNVLRALSSSHLIWHLLLPSLQATGSLKAQRRNPFRVWVFEEGALWSGSTKHVSTLRDPVPITLLMQCELRCCPCSNSNSQHSSTNFQPNLLLPLNSLSVVTLVTGFAIAAGIKASSLPGPKP